MYVQWGVAVWRRLQAELCREEDNVLRKVFKKLGYTLAVDGSQDDELDLGPDLADVKFPQTEPPKPPPRLSKKDAQAMLFEMDAAKRAETGTSLFTSEPMQHASLVYEQKKVRLHALIAGTFVD